MLGVIGEWNGRALAVWELLVVVLFRKGVIPVLGNEDVGDCFCGVW